MGGKGLPPSYETARSHRTAGAQGGGGGLEVVPESAMREPPATVHQGAVASGSAQEAAPESAMRSEPPEAVDQGAVASVSSQAHKEWIVRVAKVQFSEQSSERSEVFQRADELKQVQRTRAKCTSIVQRGDKLKKEMHSSVQSMSVVRSKAAAEQASMFQRLAIDSSSRMQGVAAAADDEEEISDFLTGLAVGGINAVMDDFAERKAVLDELTAIPQNNDETEAKFKLYENFAATSLAIRDELFKFVDGGDGTAAMRVIAEMKEALKKIDGAENLGVREPRADVWFVRDMAEQVFQNVDMQTALLHRFEKKLELLAHAVECPVCFEPFGEGPRKAQVLGCCHSVCTECWKNIQLLCAAQNLCPVCRHQEFLVTISQSVDI